MPAPRKNAKSTRGRPFPKGNPGRREGSRNKVSLQIEQLLEGEAEAIGRRCIAKALEGDGVALKLAMERLAPLRRGRPVTFELPEPLDSAADLSRCLGSVLRATANGSLSPDEALQISQVIESRRRAIETVELEARISVLEGSSR